jgi:WD40 repeat protein
VLFGPDGKSLALIRLPGEGESENTIEQWDIARRQRIGEPVKTGKQYQSNSRTAYRDDGVLVVCVAESGGGGPSDRVKVLNASNGTLLQDTHQVGGDYRGGLPMLLGPNGRSLATRFNDTTWKLWNVDDLDASPSFVTLDAERLECLILDEAADLLLTKHGERLALWKVNEVHTEVAKTNSRQFVAMHPGGTEVAVAAESRVRIYDAGSGELKQDLFDYSEDAIALSYAASGGRLALATAKTVEICDVALGKRESIPLEQPDRVAFQSGESYLTSAVFHPELKTLAAGFGRYGAPESGVVIWSLPSGKLLHAPLEAQEGNYKGGIVSIALSMDGSKLAGLYGIENNNGVVVWNVSDGRRIGRPHISAVKGYEQYWSIAFGPDDRRVWAGYSGRGVGVVAIDLESGELQDEIPLSDAGADFQIKQFAFSRDGSKLLIGTQHTSPPGPGPIQIWDIEARAFLDQPHIPSASLDGLSLNSDGDLFAIAVGSSSDERYQTFVYDKRPGTLLRRAERLAGRNLTSAEWRRFVGAETPYHATFEALPRPEGEPSVNDAR